MGKTLFLIGVAIAGLGLLMMIGLPLFRLPGDLMINRPGFKIFFPITSMIVISAVVSLLMWLFRR